jgi:hypothetical protein
MKFASLNDLYLQQLKDLHSAEGQLVKALPKMAFCRELHKAICGARGYAKGCNRGAGVVCNLATRRSA